VSISPLWQIPPVDSTDEYQICPNFGSIYTGECCTIRLRVYNQSSTAMIQNIRLTCTLQQSNTKVFPLLFECLIDMVYPEASTNYAFTLRVEVPDTYFLSFQLHYQLNDLADPLTLKKLNKFEAKPLFKYGFESGGWEDSTVVQCRLGNISNTSISLKSAEFVPSNSYAVEPLSNDLFLSDSFRSGEGRSYLFKLNASTTHTSTDALGRFMVTWWNENGDIGVVYFKEVDLQVRTDTNLSWRVDPSSRSLLVERPSSLTLHIHNRSRDSLTEAVKVVLIDSEMRGVILSPMNALALGSIEPQSDWTVELLAFPCMTGLQTLSGLHLFVRGKKVKTDELQVFVKF
jgi:hypothetical protein